MKKLDLLVLIIMLLMVSVKLGELTEEINELKKYSHEEVQNTHSPN
jgi:hypothetical protein